MSSASLEAKWTILLYEREGQAELGQRQTASSFFCLINVVLQSGHFFGILNIFSEPLLSFTNGSITSGIISPALWTITVSPIRISFRLISPSLCSVAI